MGTVTETLTKRLHGTTVREQQDAAKKAIDKQTAAQHDDGVELNAQSIKAVAAAITTSKDGGDSLVEKARIAAKALSVTTKGRTSRVTQAEIDAEAGYPNPQGAEAIAAIQRINRRGEPQGGK